MSTEVTSAEQVRSLTTGESFHSFVGELKWSEAHAIMYHTAHKYVVIALVDGTAVEGTLDEVPGYFGGFGRKVWLRQAGRKSRKGVLVAQILCWSGQKSASLAESLTAFIYLNSGGSTPEQLAEALQTAKMI